MLRNFRFISVTFFAAVVLLVETILFHTFHYVQDYFTAMMAIFYAVLGIGLGAFLAGRVKFIERKLFATCCLGMTIALFVTALVVILYPTLWLLSIVTPFCFVFPVIYITKVFEENPCDKVYLYDMTGAGLGVIATVVLFFVLLSEEIVLLLLLLIPLLGWLAVKNHLSKKRLLPMSLLLMILIGGVLFGAQMLNNSLNLFAITNRSFNGYSNDNNFYTLEPENLRKSYDSLTGRIDVVESISKEFHIILFHGGSNDRFYPTKYENYEYYKEKGLPPTTTDIRVLYGPVEEPRVFVVGSAAEGIIKTVKRITTGDRIVPVEINRGIIKAMQRDFVEESGHAYEGISPKLGNALSLLKTQPENFDIITLINTHSTRSISHKGSPDYLHTAESYNLYLDHLTDRGYILFEERLATEDGQLGLYRMIHTLWKVLEERGVEDPSQHFAIWEWMGSGLKSYDLHWRHYLSMIVTREPIVGDFREDVLVGLSRAVDNKGPFRRRAYIKGGETTEEYENLFAMIEKGDFSPLADKNFDASLITNDRPFSQMGSMSIPKLIKLLLFAGLVTIILWILFMWDMLRRGNRRTVLSLSLFNILIGMGYFLLEIVLMLTYQNVFVAPSATFLFVLAVLLIGSAIGGALTKRIPPMIATIILIPLTLIALVAPTFLIQWSIPFGVIKILAVLLIGTIGLFMGVYFPRGLMVAKEKGMQKLVPSLFAVNSIAGAFAVVLALFLGVKVGYQETVLIALLCYVLAGLMLRSLVKR